VFNIFVKLPLYGSGQAPRGAGDCGSENL